MWRTISFCLLIILLLGVLLSSPAHSLLMEVASSFNRFSDRICADPPLIAESCAKVIWSLLEWCAESSLRLWPEDNLSCSFVNSFSTQQYCGTYLSSTFKMARKLCTSLFLASSKNVLYGEKMLVVGHWKVKIVELHHWFWSSTA